MAPRPPKKKHRKDTKPAPAKPVPLIPYPPRLPTETAISYDGLCTYLDAGPDRSISAVFGPTRARIAKGWSTRNDWQARAAAWDASVRDARLAALQERQRRADLDTAEADHRLRAAATAALLDDDPFGLVLPKLPPALANLGRLARAGDAPQAAIGAAKLLYVLSGIRDLRALALHRAQATPPDKEAPADPAVVAALERATPEQLAAMRPAPVSIEDEYAADPDAEG